MKNSTYFFDVSGGRTVNYVINEIKKYKNRNQRPIRVLDIGCGTGQLTYLLALLDNIKIDAIDIDESSLNIAKDFCADIGSVNFFCVSIEDFKEKRYKYDVVIMTQVMDHIHNPKEILKKVNSLMVEGGIVIGGVSNGYGLYEKSKNGYNQSKKIKFPSSKRLKLLKKTPYTCNIHSPHMHKFTMDSIIEIFKEFKFKKEKFKGITFILPAYPFNILFYHTPMFVGFILEKIDYAIATILPKSCASNWFFTFSKISEKESCDKVV